MINQNELWPVGQTIEGLYEVRGVNTEGGMSIVYFVWHKTWKKELVIKTPRPQLMKDQQSRDDFTQEAETWVKLGMHPNIVNLLAKFVIHTVGPRWKGGSRGESGQLASCYRRSLELACAYGLRSIAFPAISTGIFGYPIEKAATIAIQAVNEFSRLNPDAPDVVFCCYCKDDLDIYQTGLNQLTELARVESPLTEHMPDSSM